MKTKHCAKCNQTLPLKDFYSTLRKDGKKIWQHPCKDCKKKELALLRATPEHKEKVRLYRKAHRQTPHGQAAYQEDKLRRKYGITLKQFNKMRKDQCFSCKICGIHESKLTRSLHVDHCHETNKVRGLLCHGCNVSIGLFNEDVDILASAISYLQQ